MSREQPCDLPPADSRQLCDPRECSTRSGGLCRRKYCVFLQLFVVQSSVCRHVKSTLHMLMRELLISVNQHKDDPLVIGFCEFENTTGFGTSTSIWLHGLPISSANESNAGVRDDGEHCRGRWERLREL